MRRVDQCQHHWNKYRICILPRGLLWRGELSLVMYMFWCVWLTSSISYSHAVYVNLSSSTTQGALLLSILFAMCISWISGSYGHVVWCFVSLTNVLASRPSYPFDAKKLLPSSSDAIWFIMYLREIWVQKDKSGYVIKMFCLSMFHLFTYIYLYFSGNKDGKREREREEGGSGREGGNKWIKVCNDHFVLEHGNLFSNKQCFHTWGLMSQKDLKLSILSMSFTEKEFAPLSHLPRENILDTSNLSHD